MRKDEITPELIRQLLHEQFPAWASLPLRPVEKDGWDNLTMRLGDTMSVRMPSADMYSSQVDKEHRWLPMLRDRLPIAIPNPLGKGVAGQRFPRPWSVYEWLTGRSATVDEFFDRVRLAQDLAAFLRALYTIDPTGGPRAGEHSFHRGAHPSYWDDSARAAIDATAGIIDAPDAVKVWERALSSRWETAPVWFHGDMSGGNLLVQDGKLSAVIDFGTCGIGDPACDLVVAWSLFSGESREAFRDGLDLDADTWARARGWMVWKAAVTLKNARAEGHERLEQAGLQFGWRAGVAQVLADVLAEDPG